MNFAKSLPCLAVALVLTGCSATFNVPIKDPAQSSIAYSKSSSTLQPVSLAIEDARDAKNKEQFVTSRLPWTMSLFYKDKPFEAQPWLAGQVVNEMTARGLPVAVAKDGIAGTKLSFKRISIETHRVNGFSPFVTFASLRAEVETPQGMQRVSA